MPDQALHSAQRLGEREDAGALDEAPRPLQAPELQTDHAPEPLHLAARELVLRVRRQAGVVNPLHLGMVREPLGDAAAVRVVLPHAERERLGAAQREPAVERPRHRARRVLDEPDALGQVVAVHDHHPPHHVAVAVQVLGGRVQHDVGAELERALEAGRREGVVHDQQGARPLRDVGRRPEVAQPHHRVRGRFGEEHPGRGCDGRRDGVRVGAVHEGERQAEPGPHVRHLAVRAAVHVLPRDDVVPGREQLQHRVDRGEARAEGEAVAAAFERRDVPLQRLAGRVARAGVLVSLVPAEAVLHVGGGLIDGRHHGAGERVGDLAGVDGPGGETAGQVVLENLGHGRNVRAPFAPSKRPIR